MIFPWSGSTVLPTFPCSFDVYIVKWHQTKYFVFLNILFSWEFMAVIKRKNNDGKPYSVIFIESDEGVIAPYYTYETIHMKVSICLYIYSRNNNLLHNF